MRYAILLACTHGLGIAYGFPGPKPAPQQPPTESELVLGTWEGTKENGKALRSPYYWEFRADGSIRVFGRAGGRTNNICYYSLVENRLQIASQKGGKPEIDWQIQVLTEQRLTVGTNEFIRK